MAKRKRKKEAKSKLSFSVEIYSIILILIGVLGICGYGPCGKLICAFFAFLCGTLYLIPLIGIILVGVYLLFTKHYPDFLASRIAGLILVMIGLLIVVHMSFVLKPIENGETITWNKIITNTFNEVVSVFSTLEGKSRTIAFSNTGGGMLGGLLLSLNYSLFDIEGTKIIYWILIVGGGLLFTGLSIVNIIKQGFNKSKELIPHHEKEDNDHIIGIPKGETIDVKIRDNTIVKENDDGKTVINSLDEIKNRGKQVNEIEDEEISPRVVNNINYHLPTTDLLDKPKVTATNNQANIEKNINILEEVLNEFGVIGKVVAVTVGPACTQYELAIKAGTKLSRLTSINREISLALAKKDVRIQAPIPGKSTCGIEIANDEPTTIYIKEIMDDLKDEIEKNPDKYKNNIYMALGKDIKGAIQTYPINKTPHMLVAGATGSGKSVCINCILASILMTKKPDEVKLILVDPKKVELSMYNGVPHLLCPVVTDPKKAAAALQKVVSEMEHRYDLFEENKVKNIDTYNELVEKQNKHLSDSDKKAKLPFIVVIVDELADLMMVASKEVEDAIMRITQMARAAGIHLIIATQRPSTDVITGVIKANIPTRVAFAVSSGIDSRTILDMQGAEKLLGRGDMLFLPQGENAPTRIQGAWISEPEINRVVKYVCNQQKEQYDARFQNLDVEGKVTTGVDANTEVEDEYDDPLYNDIVEFVVTSGKASASLLQRRFKLGYNRAARVIDLLEERGIIGPMNGSKPREVLVKLNKDNDDEII